MATYRRFGRLNALNLLYFQAQLVRLEQRLESQCEADKPAQAEIRRLYSQDWNLLSAGGTREGGDGWFAVADYARSGAGNARKTLSNAEAECTRPRLSSGVDETTNDGCCLSDWYGHAPLGKQRP